MAPLLVFIGISLLSLVSIAGLMMQTSRGQRVHPWTNLLLLCAIGGWGGTYGIAFQQTPVTLQWGLTAHAVLLGAMYIFCHNLTSRHINTHKALPWVGFCTVVLMIILPILPLTPSLLLSLYAFVGVMNCLGIFLYCERLHQVLKANGQHGRQMVLSLGVIAGALFIMFCDIMVHPRLSEFAPQSIGMVYAIAFPFLYQGLQSIQQIPRKLCVSRPLAFHTTLFTIAGCYLLGLSFAGQLSQMYGLTYTSTITLLGAMAMPLLYLLSSGRLRRNILVWVNKHFFSAQFDYRQTWRQLTQAFLPDLGTQKASETGLAAIQHAIHHEYGHFYRRKKKGAEWTLAASTSPNALSDDTTRHLFDLADDILDKGWIIDIHEWQNHPQRYLPLSACPSTIESAQVHWIVPVNLRHGAALWIVSGGSKPHWPLNWETRDFLSSLATHLESYLHTQESRQQLYENAQLAAFHQTSAFVVHDLKNLFAQLSLVNRNAAIHKNNPAFIEDMLVTLSGMQERMGKMLGQLSTKQHSADIRMESIDVCAWWHQMQKDATSMAKYGVMPSFYSCESGQEVRVRADRERLTNVLKHLLDNAMYASQGKDSPHVFAHCTVSFEDNCVMILIEDNGVGMDEAFIKNRLFKPFETTKGNSGIGIGVYDAKQFAEQSGGALTIDSQLGVGTRVRLILPRSGA